jgi:hypothetical protein
MGRNSLRGPGNVAIDMGLTRTFQVREKQTLQIRAEAFNPPNHVNLQNPAVNLAGSTFGRTTTADDQRIIQLTLKYVF